MKRTLGLISVVKCFISLSVTVYEVLMPFFFFLWCCEKQACSLSCTLIKYVDFFLSQERPGFQKPTASFLSSVLVWKECNWNYSSKHWRLLGRHGRENNGFFFFWGGGVLCFCFALKMAEMWWKLHIYQIRLKNQICRNGALYMWSLGRSCFTLKPWSMLGKKNCQKRLLSSLRFHPGASCKIFFFFPESSHVSVVETYLYLGQVWRGGDISL